MAKNNKSDAIDAFFSSFAEGDEEVSFKFTHEVMSQKLPVIHSGSYLIDDALSSGGLPKGRLIQFYGPPACHGKGTPILMFDGSIKPVEQIKIGDKLMGMDSKPRTVISLNKGFGEMFRINPFIGESFTINKDHILTLERNNILFAKHLFVKRNRPNKSGQKRNRKSNLVENSIVDLSKTKELVDMSFRDYLKLSKRQRKAFYLKRAPVDSFENSDKLDLSLTVPPYILGLLIGDGSLISGVELTTADNEILLEFEKWVNSLGMSLHKLNNYKDSKCDSFRAINPKNIEGIYRNQNIIKHMIQSLNLNKRSYFKFIPFEYKTASRNARLNILAGLIDTDGSLALTKNHFDFISKSPQLANDVAFIARSLGFHASVNSCVKSAYVGHSDIYYRVYISGDLYKIPTRLERKSNGHSKKDVLHSGFTFEQIEDNEFFGFTVDGDNRYLLGDFTITHNCGKSMMATLAIAQAQKADKKAVQVFVDAEQTYDPTWAAKLGVDPKRVLLVDGDLAVNGRRCFTMLLGEPKADAKGILVGKKKDGLFDKIVNGEINCNLVVLDSLGAIIPPGEDVSYVGKVNMAKMARFLTTELKKLSLEVKKANVPMIIINHKRDNLDPYGVDHTFAGGNSYAHHLSANLYFEAVQRKDSYILDENENKVGGLIRVTVEKSKFGPHPRKCEIKVDFRVGVIGINEEIAQLAVNYGIVARPNTKSYEYGDKKWVGAANFHEAIKESPELMNELLSKIEEVRETNRTLKLEEQQAAKKQIVDESLEETESTEDSE